MATLSNTATKPLHQKTRSNLARLTKAGPKLP